MTNNQDNEEVEILDIEDELTNKIDEFLDVIDTPEQIKETKKVDLSISNKNKVSDKKLNGYKSKIKNINIKNIKTKSIVKHALICIVIILLVCIEFFINKTGEVLTNIRVYATDNQPIRIVQNGKYGYIDYLGTKLVNPKYSYGEEFIKGYAIVKDSSNLPLIINKGGKEVVSTGTYFSLLRAGTDIIASKVTKKGLKYGILDANLKVKTEFTYDLINYENNCFTYVKGNNVGIINLSGKDIYNFKLTDEMDKKINISSFEKYEDNNQKYGVVSINSSSQIINLKTGKLVTSPTLDEIVLLKNNVFKQKSNDKTLFLYVEDDKVILESDSYENIEVPSIKAGIIIATNKDYTKQYISTKTSEQIYKNLTDNEAFMGDEVFVFLTYDYKNKKDQVNIVKEGIIYKTFDKTFDIKENYTNGYAVVKQADETYSYIDYDGNILGNLSFDEAYSFDKYGHALAKTKDGYGVIDKEGKIIIPFENNEIKMASYLYKKNSNDENYAFFAVKKDNLFALYNKKGKLLKKDTYYENVTFDKKYPIIKLETETSDFIYNSLYDSKIELTSSNSKYKVYENYIIYNNEYYNYKGKLIYVDNSK